MYHIATEVHLSVVEPPKFSSITSILILYVEALGQCGYSYSTIISMVEIGMRKTHKSIYTSIYIDIYIDIYRYIYIYIDIYRYIYIDIYIYI